MELQAVLTTFRQSIEQSDRLADNAIDERLWDPATQVASWTWDRDISCLSQLWKTALPIWLSDMLAVCLSIVVASTFFDFCGAEPGSLNWRVHLPCWCLAISGGCLLGGLYPATGMTSTSELKRLTRVIGTVVVLSIVYALVHSGKNAHLALMCSYGTLSFILISLLRSLCRRLVCHCRWWGFRTIIVGAGQAGLQICQLLERHPALGFKPVAMVDRYRPDWFENPGAMPAVGIFSLEDTPRLCQRHQAYCGIFVGSDFPPTNRVTMVDTLTSVFPQLYITPDSADAGRRWSGQMELGSLQLMRVTERLLLPGARWLKRGIDITAVLLAAPIIVPSVLFLAALVKWDSPGPAFYCSTRVGRNNRTIRAWKLRTMVPNADQLLKEYLEKNPDLRSDWERLHKLPRDPRVTSLGRFLRKSSLDELPQLLNVIWGEMSLVGPRPIPHAQIPKYQSVYPLYARVTPGITGLWQVNGRSSTTHEERVGYDAEYVRNWSIVLDFYILAQTIRAVVTCKGAC